jgi:3-oxoacyl-(acyl-carrier-protein) synthase
VEPAIYDVSGGEGAFQVAGLNDPTMRYVTKEAAFEAAVASAWTAIKQGRSVVIRVRGSDGSESALGDVHTA